MASHSSYLVCGTRFDCPAKYSLIKPIGKGAYGVVCSANNNETGKKAAIKKIIKAFEHLTDSKRTLREIKLLRHFHHENIISIEDILQPTSYEAFEDVYIVSELMDTDLHQIIGSPQPLTDDHCQYFLYQILRGLKYIHSADVLHRDLKPSNLLLNGNCDLKICDFGLARFNQPGESSTANFMTEYVATRWYRAPEIMLSWREYTKAIDMWSVGCIFAELLGRRPLFPGRDFLHQLSLITDVLGSPSNEDIAGISNEKAKRYARSIPHKPRIPVNTIYQNANPVALDLLQRMLVFNPEHRLTVDQALAHPYLAPLHDPSDEPTCHAPFNFEFENRTLTKEIIKELTFQEMLAFHPPIDEHSQFLHNQLHTLQQQQLLDQQNQLIQQQQFQMQLQQQQQLQIGATALP